MQHITRKVEQLLTFLGYTGGFILFLESVARVISFKDYLGIKIFMFSVLIWFCGRLMRRNIKPREVVNTGWVTARLELTYFLFCHTFVLLFISTVYKYTLFGYSYYGLSTYSRTLTYLTRDFAFLLLINLLFFSVFISVVLFLSTLLYKYLLNRYNFLTADHTKKLALRSFSTAVFLVLFFLTINTYPVWGLVNGLSMSAGNYMRIHFQWIMDFVFASPITFYVLAAFKGSEAVEEFNLSKRLI